MQQTNKRLENLTTTATSKKNMIEWLQDRNIPCDERMTKPQLYELIKAYKRQNIRYRIHDIMKEYGHTVLRLPPYHRELNPIEKNLGSSQELGSREEHLYIKGC
ncbi:hypothetical protein NQ317_008443 [Molorchus minor]|uniref:Transposase n=1 Tax=Molorchus minor TaxID=1323400 RepID=A0ABQ9JD48_9CUCU|nr:hypothetical protein NQ317_008443 [Molorchus minor]